VIRVAVGEDNAIFARGIAEVLNDAPDIQVVGVGDDRDRLLALVARERVDVVLSDIRMPPTHSDEGMQVARRVFAADASVAVVLLSQYVNTAVALELLAGAGVVGRRGYLLKDRVGQPVVLQAAIRDVAAGGSVVDPLVVEALIAGRGSGGTDALAGLTPRELDVLRLVAQGLANQAIADRMRVGRPGVEKHLTAIFQKLGIREDSQQVNRRVSAALLYLAGRTDESTGDSRS
jgi:hypothetical protein